MTIAVFAAVGQDAQMIEDYGTYATVVSVLQLKDAKNASAAFTHEGSKFAQLYQETRLNQKEIDLTKKHSKA